MKLDLEELEVQSFVTSLPEESKTLVKGGALVTSYCTKHPCPVTGIWPCPTDPGWPNCGG